MALHELANTITRRVATRRDRLLTKKAPNILAELGCRRVALFRLSLHGLDDDSIEIAAKCGCCVRRRR